MTAPLLSLFRLWADKMACVGKERKKTRQKKHDQRLIALASHYPTKDNDIKNAKRLLEKGANPNAQQGLALRKATLAGRSLFVETLLAAGACPDFIDSELLEKLRARNAWGLLDLIRMTQVARKNKAKIVLLRPRTAMSARTPIASALTRR